MTDLNSDPISRACERHFVKPGSAAERTVRSNAYQFLEPTAVRWRNASTPS